MIKSKVISNVKTNQICIFYFYGGNNGKHCFSIIALLFALVGLVLLLGIFNWIAIILAFVALISGIVGASAGNHRGACVVGILISILVLCVAVIRLVIGGGIL